MNLSASRGSTPLELVLVVSLLLLPIGPVAALAAQINQELAAESIARNALRLAMLKDSGSPERSVSTSAAELARNWKVELAGSRVWCSSGCELISLEIQVGSARAVHTMGKEP